MPNKYSSRSLNVHFPQKKFCRPSQRSQLSKRILLQEKTMRTAPLISMPSSASRLKYIRRISDISTWNLITLTLRVSRQNWTLKELQSMRKRMVPLYQIYLNTRLPLKKQLWQSWIKGSLLKYSKIIRSSSSRTTIALSSGLHSYKVTIINDGNYQKTAMYGYMVRPTQVKPIGSEVGHTSSSALKYLRIMTIPESVTLQKSYL